MLLQFPELTKNPLSQTIHLLLSPIAQERQFNTVQFAVEIQPPVNGLIT